MSAPRLDERLARFPSRSYLADANVPRFDDSRPLIVFDGVCVLCSGFARYVMRNDPGGLFRLTTAQSALGQALMHHYGIDPANPETNLLIWNGQVHGKLDAFVRIMGLLGRHRLAGVMIAPLPPDVADWIYDRIATNRYRLFGRTEQCMMPAPEWRDRIIG